MIMFLEAECYDTNGYLRVIALPVNSSLKVGDYIDGCRIEFIYPVEIDEAEVQAGLIEEEIENAVEEWQTRQYWESIGAV